MGRPQSTHGARSETLRHALIHWPISQSVLHHYKLACRLRILGIQIEEIDACCISAEVDRMQATLDTAQWNNARSTVRRSLLQRPTQDELVQKNILQELSQCEKGRVLFSFEVSLCASL